MFAIQHGGWCASARRAHLTYRRYGKSNRCRNGKGGPWANDVYVLRGIKLNISLPGCPKPLYQSKTWYTTIQYENEFNLHVNEISISHERMVTKTRFEKEAKDKSEMAY